MKLKDTCSLEGTLWQTRQHIKKQKYHLPTKLHIVKAVVFPVLMCARGFPSGSVVKNQPANAGDTEDVGSISGLGRSLGVQFNSIQSLSQVWLFETRLPCLSPTPRPYPNSSPLSQWCHPTISSSVIPFSSCPQSYPTSGSFPMTQLFASDGQSIRASASASVLQMNTQNWFPEWWTAGSPCSSRDSQESSPTPQFKSINSLALSFLYSPTLTSIHDYWKNHSLD